MSGKSETAIIDQTDLFFSKVAVHISSLGILKVIYAHKNQHCPSKGMKMCDLKTETKD